MRCKRSFLPENKSLCSAVPLPKAQENGLIFAVPITLFLLLPAKKPHSHSGPPDKEIHLFFCLSKIQYVLHRVVHSSLLCRPSMNVVDILSAFQAGIQPCLVQGCLEKICKNIKQINAALHRTLLIVITNRKH